MDRVWPRAPLPRSCRPRGSAHVMSGRPPRAAASPLSRRLTLRFAVAIGVPGRGPEPEAFAKVGFLGRRRIVGVPEIGPALWSHNGALS